MKKFKSLVALLIITLSIILSSLPVSAVGASAPSEYSAVSNSGTRHVICTTLDGTSAPDYYTGLYTYDSLAVLDSVALYNSLNALMTSTHKKQSSYSDCRDMAVKTDCENGDGRINLIYSSVSVTRSDYINDRSNGWNREHVWPKSLGGFNESGPGGDLHHIRPSDSKLNSIRGNDKYGNVTNGKAVSGTSLVNGMIGGYSSGGYFEPLDDVKGDVARICLYVYVRYGTTYSKCSNITAVFRDVDTLLEWCALDPVDTWEMGRNEVVGAYQGNRNVFIDYPEYAWLLFGEEIPDDLVSPTSASRQSTDPDDKPDTPPDGGEENPDTPPDGGDDKPDTPPECSHAVTSLKNQKPATCSAEGYTGDLCCDGCGEVIESGESIPMTEHEFEITGETEDGMQEETCVLCGFIRILPPEPKTLWETVRDFFRSVWESFVAWFEKWTSSFHS